jgi:signal transduction histidine kinase
MTAARRCSAHRARAAAPKASDDVEQRILILAPYGRDAEVIDEVLAKDGRQCVACAAIASLVGELARGAGAALIAEEALDHPDISILSAWLQAQSSWSDFPFVLLLARRRVRSSGRTLDKLEALNNVVGLERPLNGDTLRRAASSALRARLRQYEARRLEAERAEEQKQLHLAQARLNDTLEMRIAERTKELAAANDRLMKENHERAKMQAVLAQTQKMEALGQLTGGIAHDFNNLLNVIMGNAELITRVSSDERIRAMALAAKRATERGAKLTSQLLTFARRSNLDLKALDAAALLRGMSDMLSLSLGTSVHFGMEFETDEAWVEADANQLELAVLNLAINSRDAMPQGGVVTFKVATRPAADASLQQCEHVVIGVTDTGSGIAPETLSRVFDPFFTTKPVGKGTGLGLSQVYGIARQAGGTARMRSELGAGTTVEIWLPRVDVSAMPHLAERIPVEVGGQQERVLVIEDDPDVRTFLVDCLTLLGYVAIEAAHGRAGLERLAAQRPDVLMVDFAMPGMNGIEVITEARKTHPGLPAILATGYADADVNEGSCVEYAVLRKPFQIAELNAALKAALARTRT